MVLDQLADILSIDPDSTKEEVSRLIKRCPELLDDDGEKENHVILIVRFEADKRYILILSANFDKSFIPLTRQKL